MESEEYFELTSQIDAREILRYLNNLGINNINGEVLKLFITDLKKLIKYDLAQRNEAIKRKEYIPGPERLHSASTLSSRLKSKSQDSEPILCSRECRNYRRPLSVRNIRSTPVLGEQKCEEPPRRSCSCVRVERKSETPKDTPKSTTSNNIIKVPKQPAKKKCDPVSLYHYYIAQWTKYKPNVPGENDWADLRWNIRQKMVGTSVGPSKKVSDKENLKNKKRIIL